MPPASSEMRREDFFRWDQKSTIWLGHNVTNTFEAGDVTKVCVADPREGVVPEHGIDRFGKLGAARFVDAAGVDPYPLPTVSFREEAALLNLVPDGRGLARVCCCPLAMHSALMA